MKLFKWVVCGLLFFPNHGQSLEIPELQQHILSRTVHVTLENFNEGCTGFLIHLPESVEPVIATNIHCIATCLKIESQFLGSEPEFSKIYVSHLGSERKATSIVAYHSMADLVILKSPFTDVETFSISSNEISTDSKVVSMKHDWIDQSNKLSMIEAKVIAIRGEYANGKMSHIYHRGQPITNGFSGSALVDENGDIIGINFGSFFLSASIAAHRDVFDSLIWLKKSIDAKTLFAHHLTYELLPQNDMFSDFAIETPSVVETSAQNALYVYEAQELRSHALYNVITFLSESFSKYVINKYKSGNTTNDWKKVAQRVIKVMSEAKDKLKSNLNISLLKAEVDCIVGKSTIDLQENVEGLKSTDELKQSVLDACEKYLYFLKLDEKNYVRLYQTQDVKLTFDEQIKFDTAAVEKLR